MSLLVLIGIAVGLAMDATAVAVAASIALRRVAPRQVFRFAFHFGLFQAFMPLLGWAAGRTMAHHVQAWDHWVAFGLLGFVGGRAIYEAFRHKHDEEREVEDPTRGLSLVLLSLATSIDALAVGLSFAFLGLSIWYPCLVIGLVTGALTALGMLFGARLGARLGKNVEILGGLILIGIGCKILIQHLLERAGS